MHRVVITGIGVLSPIGNSLLTSWEALKSRMSGIGNITRFDASGLPWKTAGELKNFKPTNYLSLKEIRRLDPFIHYAFAAASMAVEDARFKEGRLPSAGVIVGSGRGGITSMERAFKERPTAYLMSGSTISMAASFVAGKLGIKGHVLGISTACSSGTHAIGEAFRMIRGGYADIVLAGGSEAPICRLCLEGYGVSGALSKKGVSRPFDGNRDGFIPSEGATVLVLEEYGAALKRGARIYGEISGYGNSSDTFRQTAPDMAGQKRAIKAAVKEAGIKPSDVGLISAHATSTPAGDATEAESIKDVFGIGVPVAAFKSVTGHMLGASGAFETAMALMCIDEGVIPPIVNLDNPEGDLNYVRETVYKPVDSVVVDSFGFGGVNASLIITATDLSGRF